MEKLDEYTDTNTNNIDDTIMMSRINKEWEVVKNKFLNDEKLTLMDTFTLLLKSQYNHISHLEVDVKKIDKRITDLRSEVRENIADLRGEVRENIAGLRSEMRENNANLRSEMRENIAGLRSEVKIDIHQTKSDIIKWMVGLYATTILALIGTLVTFLSFFAK